MPATGCIKPMSVLGQLSTELVPSQSVFSMPECEAAGNRNKSNLLWFVACLNIGLPEVCSVMLHVYSEASPIVAGEASSQVNVYCMQCYSNWIRT